MTRCGLVLIPADQFAASLDEVFRVTACTAGHVQGQPRKLL